MSKIPVYKTIQIERETIPEASGHTKPWVITAYTPTGLKPFVVKMYDNRQVEDMHCVTNEIIGNRLAQEFDLKVPECALIDIPVELTMNLPEEMQLQFENADDRLKFATVQLQGINSAVATLPRVQLSKRFSIEMLYAFDNLICNRDRGTKRTNLLIGDENVFLIDHELCFDKKQLTVNLDIEKNLEQSSTIYHFCYPYLKRLRNKQTFFDDFSFYLSELHSSTLLPYFEQLKYEGFSDYSEPIMFRIEQIKQKSSTFVQQLKTSLE